MNKVKSISKPKKNLFPERYKIHQYWSRKPWYVVREYLQKFSKEGERILDPFSGSGVTACESLILKRKFCGCDINPISILITKLTCISPIGLKEIESQYLDILEKTEKEILDLYTTKCRTCGKATPIINTVWKDDSASTIFYDCENCGIKNLTKLNDFDIEKNKKIAKKRIQNWYPKKICLSEDSDVEYLEELFTKRNLIGLSIIFHEINQLPESIQKEAILLMFLSTIVRCSKLIFVNKYRFSKGINPAGIWGEKRFWIPDEFIENNVHHYFSVRLKKIIQAKKETNKEIGNSHTEEIFNLKNNSAINLKFVDSESIDYCFTDPPYGGSVHYLDLSIIWNSWLKTPISYDEIVVSKTKTVSQYEQLMKKAFLEIYRVLKLEKYLTVTFHNSEIKIWNVLLDACRESGFVLKHVISQEPMKVSHNQFDMDGSVKTDMILTFQKQKNKVPIIEKDIEPIKLIKKTISQMFKTKKKTSLSEIYDKVITSWILATYQSKNKKPFLSLKDVRNSLNELKLETTEEFVKDYKGEKRKINVWILKAF